MSNHDPIDVARSALARLLAPEQTQLDTQRARLDQAMCEPTSPRLSLLARRWIPVSGLAVAGLCAAILLAIALQPGRSRDRPGSDPHRFRTVANIPGGAFHGLDLASASAAEVLRAAGQAAADGVPIAGPNDWTYVRIEATNGPRTPTSTTERWTSPDGERSYAVNTVNITNPRFGRVGRVYSVHYEHLATEVIGDVQWLEQPDGSYDRRADWHDDAGDGRGDVKRTVKLTRLLKDAHDAKGVQEALDESVEGSKLTFRNGAACGTEPRYSSCTSSGFTPQAQGLDAAESRRLFLTGQLLTVSIGAVYSPDTTRAIYDYLAGLPEAFVAPAKNASKDVILSLRVKGPSYVTHRLKNNGSSTGMSYETRPVPGTKYNTKAVAVIDTRTGRLVELGPNPGLTDMSFRYTRFGLSSAPGVGGLICDDFDAPCATARNLEDRLAKDPKAQFEGVVDWMQITQYCAGMVDRAGKPVTAAHPPTGMNDPKAQVKREACERREADRLKRD